MIKLKFLAAVIISLKNSMSELKGFIMFRTHKIRDSIPSGELKSRPETDLKFTLIELLFVIAIISILAGLLLPALSQAKKKAREIKCIGQAREITTCINLYAEDYRTYPIGKWEAQSIDYTVALRPYLWPRIDATSPLLFCPESEQGPDPYIVRYSYAVHPRIMPDISTGMSCLKTISLRRISDIILLMESCQKESASCEPILSAIPGILTDGIPADRSKVIAGDFSGHDKDGVNANAGWPRWRHVYKSSTAAFADGHVSNLKSNDLLEANIKINY